MRTVIEGFCVLVAIVFTFAFVHTLTRPEPEFAILEVANPRLYSWTAPEQKRKYTDNSDVTAEWEQIARQQALEDAQEGLERLRKSSDDFGYTVRSSRSKLASDLQDLEFDHFDSKRQLRQRFEQIDRDAAKRRQEIELRWN